MYHTRDVHWLIGAEAQPYIFISGLAAYTTVEGISMIANAFRKALREADEARGREEGRVESADEFMDSIDRLDMPKESKDALRALHDRIVKNGR